MAIIKSATSVEFQVVLALNEDEARALNAIAGYEFKAFLRVFYEHMGKTYLQPHEDGLRTLFEMAHRELPVHYNKADHARQIIAKDKTI